MSKRVIIVLVIVGAFGALMFSSMVRSCSPHVGFENARSGERVQVFGTIIPEKIDFDSSSLVLSFTIKNEEGEELPVVYSGVVPSNFEYAQQATCAGEWKGDHFQADQLLLKCPSKYEGEVEDESQLEFYNEDKSI